jgi:hypothetical protein
MFRFPELLINFPSTGLAPLYCRKFANFWESALVLTVKKLCQKIFVLCTLADFLSFINTFSLLLAPFPVGYGMDCNHLNKFIEPKYLISILNCRKAFLCYVVQLW